MSILIDEIIERMSRYLNRELSDADVARELCVGRSNVSQWRKREYVPYGELIKWASDKEDLSLDYLLEGEISMAPDFLREREYELADLDNMVHHFIYGEDRKEKKPPSESAINMMLTKEYTLLPLLDVEASAGSGSTVTKENYTGTLVFSNDWFRELGLVSSKLVVIKARGDSMIPTICAGEFLVVDTTHVEKLNDGIFVLRLDGDLFVKRLQKLFSGGVKIISDNPAYENQTIEPSDLQFLDIVGKVVWVGKNL